MNKVILISFLVVALVAVSVFADEGGEDDKARMKCRKCMKSQMKELVGGDDKKAAKKEMKQCNGCKAANAEEPCTDNCNKAWTSCIGSSDCTVTQSETKYDRKHGKGHGKGGKKGKGDKGGKDEKGENTNNDEGGDE